MNKLKAAIYWASGCGGCDVGLLDINEKLLDVLDNIEILFWPVAMDIKYKDLNKLPNLDVAIINGSIRNEENIHIVKILRKKSKILVGFGSCACEGGTLGLANLNSKEELLKSVYDESLTSQSLQNARPSTSVQVQEGKLTLPDITEVNSSLDQLVKVDYYVSGCPPPVNLIIDLFQRIAANKLPKLGSYIGPARSVCDECSRERISKPVTSINRIYQQHIDADKCLLEQGILCMGPATRGGCEAPCVKANMPCAGCGGRLDVSDQGARMIGALGAILLTDHTQNLNELLGGMKDPAGVLYKYCLAVSLLRKKVKVTSNERKERK